MHHFNMSPLRRAIVDINGGGLCSLSLSTSATIANGWNPGTPDAETNSFSIITPDAPAEGSTIYAVNSGKVFKIRQTDEGDRAFALLANSFNGNWKASFAFEVNDTDLYELRVGSPFRLYKNGVFVTDLVGVSYTGALPLRLTRAGYLEVYGIQALNSTLIHSEFLGIDVNVRFYAMYDWDDSVYPNTGVRFSGQYYTDLTHPDLELLAAKVGDTNLCRTQKLIQQEQDVAPEHAVTASTNLVEVHTAVDIIETTASETGAEPAVTATANVLLIEVHTTE